MRTPYFESQWASRDLENARFAFLRLRWPPAPRADISLLVTGSAVHRY